MTCDTKYKQEALSEEWTAAEVTQMEKEVKLAGMKASRAYTERYPYGSVAARKQAVGRAEQKARKAAHDRHIFRMLRRQLEGPGADAKAIPRGHHVHAESEA